MKATLFKRLYALLSIAVLFITTSNAQIIYTDIISDHHLLNGINFYNLDLNNDGITDYQLYYDHNSDYCGSCVNSYYHNYKKVTPYNINKVLDSNSYPLKLTAGNLVSPTINKWNGNSTQILINDYFTCSLYFCVVSQSFGNWGNAADNYLGLKFFVNGNILLL
ncbi:MAG: hypothetical protein ABIT08_13855 [Bacteroidia bacterium]